MNVFLLYREDDEDGVRVVEVYSSRESARADMRERKNREGNHASHWIEEKTVRG